MARTRGQQCGDIELVGYLVMRRVRCLWGWTSSLPTKDSKIRKYRADYNNNPPNSISFMSVMTGTSGRIHSEPRGVLFTVKGKSRNHP
jgi:hypothetical protein